ncbi:hypothetical protein [Streptomyces sp. NPDC013457]|uniref:hypothetical protein n=1 Tax=Streptomyces sp. NPDC013457 TaxID=3364866 RepID=UPI0037004C37
MVIEIEVPGVQLPVADGGWADRELICLQVTLGQDCLPSRIGTASGVTLGLTASIGGLISPLLGHLADSTSLKTALPLIAMPALSRLLCRALPEPTAPSLKPTHPRPHPRGRTPGAAQINVHEQGPPTESTDLQERGFRQASILSGCVRDPG